MNKTEALARLSALEAEAKALREIIETPEPEPSLLPAEWDGNGRFCISNVSGNFDAGGPYKDAPIGQNFFDSGQLADAWAKAITTMIELRRQPGTEVPDASKEQTTIEYDGNKISYQWWVDESSQIAKFARISPCFKSVAHAKAAVEKLGEARLKQMFNTFHGVSTS